MFTENFFTTLINLEDGWEVQSIETNHGNGEIHISIVCRLQELADDQTGELCKVYDHAPERGWRHLDTMQYKTFITCKLPRIIASNGKVKTVQPDWASGYKRHTYLFEHAVIDLLKATRNQTKTAPPMRWGFNIVNRILHVSTHRGMGRRNYSQVVFDQLNIDGKSFRKGHHYMTVLSHPQSGCVLDVWEDRTKESVRSLLNKSLTNGQLQQVKAISMDMWKAFISTAEEMLPNAAIVHDRFHLVKYLNEAIDKVRRREVRQHEELKNSRYALLKNPENLTEKQRIHFDAIAGANYEVSKAWQVRENFKDLFSSEKLYAWKLYLRWTVDSQERKIKEINKVVDMFNNQIKGVVNAMLMNLNNASSMAKSKSSKLFVKAIV